MNIKRILKVMTITPVLCLATLSPCYAARIYNFTNKMVGVRGGGGLSPHTDIPANKRSGSLEWTGTTKVDVFRGSNKWCSLDFGAHNQIVGGNYMIIEQSKNCFVCDSNRHAIVGHGNCR
jgi:hypothetical protein